MKHLFFAVAMLTVSINGSAQSLTPVYEGSFSNGYTIIPQEYSFNNQINIIDMKGSHLYDIYDENFNKRKSIVIPENSFIITTELYDVTANRKEYLMLTQTLFNDDSKFEYLLPLENNEGVRVVNEDGTELGCIQFHSDFKLNMLQSLTWSQVKTFDLGTKKYLAFIVNKEGDDSWTYLVYSIDDISTGAKLVAMTKGPRVSPTIANRSEMITVELEGENSQGREVSVVNAAGQTVMKTMIPAGQKSTQINASTLSQGLNVLNVKGEQGATKIIIK